MKLGFHVLFLHWKLFGGCERNRVCASSQKQTEIVLTSPSMQIRLANWVKYRCRRKCRTEIDITRHGDLPRWRGREQSPEVYLHPKMIGFAVLLGNHLLSPLQSIVMHEIPLSIGRRTILAYKFQFVLVLQAWKWGKWLMDKCKRIFHWRQPNKRRSMWLWKEKRQR